MYGQPRNHRPWRKILVVVEGIYSMEGAICKLKEIVTVVKKYKAYIYVDEAHSIGALGHTGRGICEYCDVNPEDIDILMGTFTKSFSGMGGYVAGDKATINFLRVNSGGALFHNSLSPIVTQQVITAFDVIEGVDESPWARSINRLISNSNFFRSELEQLGLHVYGDHDSPIIPVMIYFPAKIGAFSRECLKRPSCGGGSFLPPCHPLESQILHFRHTREDLLKALESLRKCQILCGCDIARAPSVLKYSRKVCCKKDRQDNRQCYSALSLYLYLNPQIHTLVLLLLLLLFCCCVRSARLIRLLEQVAT